MGSGKFLDFFNSELMQLGTNTEHLLMKLPVSCTFLDGLGVPETDAHCREDLAPHEYGRI